MSNPAVRPRPMGGFNTGFGNFSDEQLDESSFQAAAQQSQQAAQAQQLTPAQMQQAAQQAQAGEAGPDGAQADQPRAVGTLMEELVTRPVKDIGEQLGSFFDLNKMLGIDNSQENAQNLAKKKRMIQAYNRLNSEQQQYAQQQYQKRLREKQQAEQAEQQRKQAEAAQKSQSLSVPSGPQKGPVGPSGSKKQKAVTQLQQNRKTLSGPSDVN